MTITTPAKFGIAPLAKLLIVLGVGVGITVATGVVCGRVSQRWGPVPDLVAAGSHLKSLPTQLGNWQLFDEGAMSDSEIRILSCAGYVNRRYVDRHSRSTISVAIYVGPSGPISVHTPEVCYSSRDYIPESSREQVGFSDSDNRKHSFWHTTFRADNAVGERLCVYYGWFADDVWIAAESPRIAFAGRPMLFKLQIAVLVPPGSADDGPDPCRAFIDELLRSGWKIQG